MTTSPSAPEPRALDDLRQDLMRVALRDRYGRALMVVGWWHLACFTACHFVLQWPDHRPWHHVALWGAEVAGILALLRLLIGRLWFRATPLAGVVVRVWSTFLILAFNLATLNSLTGFGVDWYKSGWTALSTFGFAAMAWLLDWRFLVPAVQMYLTGLLVTVAPSWAFLTYGVSWWLALQYIGGHLEWRRRSPAATPRSATPRWGAARSMIRTDRLVPGRRR